MDSRASGQSHERRRWLVPRHWTIHVAASQVSVLHLALGAPGARPRHPSPPAGPVRERPSWIMRTTSSAGRTMQVRPGHQRIDRLLTERFERTVGLWPQSSVIGPLRSGRRSSVRPG